MLLLASFKKFDRTSLETIIMFSVLKIEVFVLEIEIK